MELKHIGIGAVLLYVHTSFNQTRMELKRGSGYKAGASCSPFNQTRMELKLIRALKARIKKLAFNQTRMELKHIPI